MRTVPDTLLRARRRGFTLVELLVAISILAVVAVLGWRGLDSIVRARTSLTEQMETTRGMQLAFAQMQSDCEHKAGREAIDLITTTPDIAIVLMDIMMPEMDGYETVRAIRQIAEFRTLPIIDHDLSYRSA